MPTNREAIQGGVWNEPLQYSSDMAIIDDVLRSLPHRDAPVREVRLGLRASAVWSIRVGLAYAFPRDPAARPLDEGSAPAPGDSPARLGDRSAGELADLARSKDYESASLGLAAIQSVLPLPAGIVDGLVFDWILHHGAGKRIGMVGHFPMVDRLRPLARAVDVLELTPQEGDLPAEAAPRVLPQADVVVISGSTLVNHTLDDLLALVRGKPVLLLGPSSPLSPVLFDHGVSVVCGAIVIDPLEALRDVSEGLGFRRMRGLRRVMLTK
ncbi:MAG: DUF364 domain-containing protein [Candidatus Eisenbacteria bacterium]|nr:DUF364 domain-containing protein [Candidatus Eisenbacteria bacterium]